MKIHLQSDTHIEMGPAIGPSVASDVAVCAGDIGLINNLGDLSAIMSSTTTNIIRHSTMRITLLTSMAYICWMKHSVQRT